MCCLKIHTYEMVNEIFDSNEALTIRNNLKDIRYILSHKDKYTKYKYFGICNKGITITVMYFRYADCIVVLQINPQTVMGLDGKSTLLEIDREKLEACNSIVGGILKRYGLKLEEFAVSRIDFTRDIQFEQREVVDNVIKLLRKTGAPYRYNATKYGQIEYENSYDISNEVNSVVVYNKEKQYAEREGKEKAEILKGVMRIEVRMKVDSVIFQRGILCYDNMMAMEEYAEQIIKNVFIEGFYIKLERMKRILQPRHSRRNTGKRVKNRLDKAVFLAERIARHRGLKECIRGKGACFAYETIQDILQEFKERRINPVSISATESIDVIPDIKHLLGLKNEAEMQRDYEFIKENNLENKVPKYHLR